MASEELPIDAEAIEAAAEAMEAVNDNPADINHKSWEMLAEVAIREFCKAVGLRFEIETGAISESDELETVGRYVSDWHPVEQDR